MGLIDWNALNLLYQFSKPLPYLHLYFPEEIEAIKVTLGTTERFCKACLGWIKYAPFLIRMTSNDEHEYSERIRKMNENLDGIGTEISDQLFWGDFNRMAPTLIEYDQRSKDHVRELEIAKTAWSEIVRSFR